MDALNNFVVEALLPFMGPYARWAGIFAETMVKIVAIVGPLMLSVAYLTYAERRVIGAMQLRIGPNRVGPMGLLQPIADALKLLLKEVILPAEAGKFLFLIAPAISLAAALVAWAVMPFSPEVVLADVNAGLLFVLAATSVGGLRGDNCGMGLQLQIRVSGLPALGGADCVLRDCDGFCAGDGADGFGQLELVGDCAGAGGGVVSFVVLAAAVSDVCGVFYFGGGGDESRAF